MLKYDLCAGIDTALPLGKFYCPYWIFTAIPAAAFLSFEIDSHVL